MKEVFLCTPHKLGNLNHELIDRIELIKHADIFVAVLKDYGKDLTAHQTASTRRSFVRI